MSGSAPAREVEHREQHADRAWIRASVGRVDGEAAKFSGVGGEAFSLGFIVGSHAEVTAINGDSHDNTITKSINVPLALSRNNGGRHSLADLC